MEVSLTAQRPAVHADGRRCTWMYETRNETTQVDGSVDHGALPARASPRTPHLLDSMPGISMLNAAQLTAWAPLALAILALLATIVAGAAWIVQAKQLAALREVNAK